MWREARRLRYERRQISSGWLIEAERVKHGLDPAGTARAGDKDWVRPPRPARCRWRAASDVSVHGDSGGAHFSGTEQCKSIWACPVCSSVIRAGRSAQIEQAVTAHREAGGGMYLVTLTLRHSSRMALADTLDAVLNGFRKLTQPKNFSRWMEKEKRLGQIRSTEITYGSHGWHPHLHLLFFVGRKATKTGAARWRKFLAERWLNILGGLGYQADSRSGVDVQAVTATGEVVGKYLSKFQDGDDSVRDRLTSVAKEITRSDFKRGRFGSFLPFELLSTVTGKASAIRVGLKRRKRLWVEYFEATRGRRAIEWSGALRDWFKEVTGGEEVKSDDQIIEDQETRQFRFLVPGDVWDTVQNSPGVLTLALEAVETDRLEVAVSLLGGYVPTVHPETGEILVHEYIDPATGEVLDSAEVGTSWHGEALKNREPMTTLTPVERGKLRDLNERLVLRDLSTAASVRVDVSACWVCDEDLGESLGNVHDTCRLVEFEIPSVPLPDDLQGLPSALLSARIRQMWRSEGSPGGRSPVDSVN